MMIVNGDDDDDEDAIDKAMTVIDVHYYSNDADYVVEAMFVIMEDSDYCDAIEALMIVMMITLIR